VLSLSTLSIGQGKQALRIQVILRARLADLAAFPNRDARNAQCTERSENPLAAIDEAA